MKKLLLLLQLAVCCMICKAQAPPRWLWAEAGGSGFGYGDGLKINNDTLFIFGRIGGSLSLGGLSISGGTVPYVGMYDTAGSTNNNGIWLSDNYTNSGFAYADAMALDKEDNTYITSCDGSGNGIYIQRYNRYGTSKWLTDEPNSNCRGYGVAPDNRGNLYSAGNYSGSSITFGSYTLPYGGSAWAGYITKQDTATGTFKWATHVAATSGSNNNYIVAGRCATDNEGYAYIAGSYQGTPTFYSIDSPSHNGPAASVASTTNNWGDLFVAKYDSNGNLVFVITAQDAGAPYNSYGYAPQVVVDSCNNIYVAGIFQNTATFGTISVTSSANSGGYNFFVAKWNALAQQWEWVQTGASAASNSAGTLTLDRNSDVYVAGHYSGTPFTIGDTTLNSGNTFVAKYANSLGALIWVANATTSGPGGIGVDSLKYVYLSGNMGLSATFGSINVSTSQNGTWLAKLDTFPVRTIVPVVSANYCPGSTVILPYSITGTFGSSNVFTAQLSNDSGSFINPVFLGDTATALGGGMFITIPANTPPGSNYLIRVISSSPAGSSYASGCSSYFINNVYINDFYVTIGSGGKIPAVITAVPGDTICLGGSLALTASGGTGYLWFNGDTSHTIILYPTVDTTYSVVVSNGGCTKDTSINIIVNSSSGTLDVEPQGYALCYGSSVTLYVAGGGSNFTWSPATGLNQTTGDSVVANPTATITYTVTGNLPGGCLATGTDEVDVIPAPNKPAISKSGDVLTSSATQGNQWYVNDTLITGATDEGYTITHSGCYAVSTINPANGCTATSDTLCATPTGINQLAINSDQLSIYPNPTTGQLFITINPSVMNVKDWNLEITDVLGQLLYTKTSLSYSNDIDLSNLSGGVYFITIINKSGRAVFPVVKQN